MSMENTPREVLLSRIERREAVVGVIGLGYVGLPLAVEVARSGYRVVGFDVSETVVARVNAGDSHIQDVAAEALAAFVDDGRLQATTDLSRLAECDAVSICVPTPLNKTKDVGQVRVLGTPATSCTTSATGRTICS